MREKEKKYNFYDDKQNEINESWYYILPEEY